MSIEAEERAKAQSEGPAGGDKVPPMRAQDHSDADPAVETPVEARQGFLGAPVLMVLVGGLALAIVAWIAVEMLTY
ncbi:MAG TPA: hypothetical protein VGN82_24360 [Bosea sp. (in: a-proteobacteria)]|jgi:hypothetical protein|uniref:hypothetical protein n=1 Tax=Bosea sp. (in: a-proteobacteria) TaxID=1871050 RepID=UPI002E1321F5|nr:hypothetical protein [Bosea sp. (in: a-proteobacteria)]